MILVRAYLLAGIVTHKAIWELLKRRSPTESRAEKFAMLRLVKGLKVGILLGIVAQTVMPTHVLPMAKDPHSLELAGQVIFSIGLLTAILGRVQLGANWSDIESPFVQTDTLLVSSGLYRYIRHPIYVGDLALLAGLELCLNSWLVLGVVALAPAVFYRAIHEEKVLAQRLPGYDSYLRQTKRFIPFVV